MQSILNAIGLAGSTEAGQEPRSGQKGAGTASDPYDAGNAESEYDQSNRHRFYTYIAMRFFLLSTDADAVVYV